MATLVLSAAGGAIGASIGGSVLGLSAAVIGRAAGAAVGRMIDQRLLGTGSAAVETGRVDRLRLSGASEGAAIPQVYGRMRVPGQVIWASRFLESRSSRSVGGGGKGSAPSSTVTEYSYSVSIAVALCEGVISGVGRMWADGKEVAPSRLGMRLYHGTEDQVPDGLIVAVEGDDNAPAYRGMAYAVFENLQLAPYGNRVPQFTFEVLRPSQAASADAVPSLTEAVHGVALMPGSGEYTLATETVYYDRGVGQNIPANRNSPSGKTDFVTSMDALDDELPNCGSALLVVSWFGSDLRCGSCQLKPKVEQRTVGSTGMPWRVATLERLTAEVVPSAYLDGPPVYGGTPADASVVQAIQDLRARGKSVVFYPFILMEQMAGNGLTDPWGAGAEQPPLPWRGRITTSAAPGQAGSPDRTSVADGEVAAFFGSAQPGDFSGNGAQVDYSGPGEWRYRRFVLHYARLCAQAGGVDAFCIGSEMRGLTQIRGAGDTFPAVEEFRRLADDVRAILGPNTKIGYAADWSEYFGYIPQDGSGDRYFHLDPLWAHPEIDFIGIDNYMPVSDWRDSPGHADRDWGSIYDIGYLQSNIEGGEGYDWYYADNAARDAQDRTAITDGAHNEPWIWRYKDIRSWWSLAHHERIGGIRQASPTAWVPQSKPVWFTEFGCGAIDKGANQPNKFLDPKSSESAVPHYSTGARDDLIQMQYIRAVQDYWTQAGNNPVSGVYGGPMIDMSMAHVWAWDARPYPYFPGLSALWSDAANYTTGHWINGRTSGRDLGEVVREICLRSGFSDVDTSRLYGYVRGYVVGDLDTARSALQPMMLAHGFDAVERAGSLVFRTRDGRADVSVTLDELAEHPEQESDLVVRRLAEAEISGRVQVTHVAADGAYEVRTTDSAYPSDDQRQVTTTDLNMSLTFGEASRMAERWLSEARVARDSASFALPPSYAWLSTGDIIEISEAAGPALYRIDRIEDYGILLVEATRVEPGIYIPGGGYDEGDPLTVAPPPARVFPMFMDLPLLSGNEDPHDPYLAVTADPWPGAAAVYTSATDNNYSLARLIEEAATLGVSLNSMLAADHGCIDRGAPLRVDLCSGALSSVEMDQFLNGANAMAIGDGQGGDWEIFQFQKAELMPDGTYELSLRLRGQQGTDAVMPAVWPSGSLVVLLDTAIGQVDVGVSARGLERHYRIGPVDEPSDSEDYLHLTHAADATGLRPYAPVHMALSVQSDGTHRIDWVRRSRLGGDDWSLSEIPLGEAREVYQVRVLSGSTPVRQVEVSSPGFDYTAAMRGADGVSVSYSVEVSQISDFYGNGLARRMDVNV